MTQNVKIIGAAAVALLICVGFYRWHMAEMRAALAEQTSKVESDRRAETEQRYQSRIKELEAEKPKTVPQATQVITKYIPSVVQPVEVRREDILPQVADKLPDAPGYVVLRNDDWVKIGQETVECQKTKAGLTSCEEKLASLERERDAWKNAAKPPWWKNLGKDALKVGIGIGIGAAIRR